MRLPLTCIQLQATRSATPQHVSMYVRMYVCTYVRMYVCTYVHMYVCTYVRMYVCTYVCMNVCIGSTSRSSGSERAQVCGARAARMARHSAGPVGEEPPSVGWLVWCFEHCRKPEHQNMHLGLAVYIYMCMYINMNTKIDVQIQIYIYMYVCMYR